MARPTLVMSVGRAVGHHDDGAVSASEGGAEEIESAVGVPGFVNGVLLGSETDLACGEYHARLEIEYCDILSICG